MHLREKAPIRVSIKLKLILVIVPLIIATVFITGFFATLSAQAGITRIAIDALAFKGIELEKYAKSQWDILVQNNVDQDPQFREAAELSILSYAKTLLQSESEKIFALDIDATPATITMEVYTLASLDAKEISPIAFSDIELAELIDTIQNNPLGWTELTLEGERRVGHSFLFEPFRWHVFITESSDVFFAEANGILSQSLIIAGISLVISLFLSVFFINYTTRPIKSTVDAMISIIRNNDLSTRVEVKENDEFGQMAHTFNIMTEELSKAYNQIKSYALQATLAQKTENKIRNIFQKYVPNSVIENIFEHPDKMLTGENRELSVMFTDIRSFTSISEGMNPTHLVSSLNRYFSVMVDVISEHGGVTDKYIGDAIMAIFGAPNRLPNSPMNAVEAALGMIEALEKFNAAQKKADAPEFITGIGIVYGQVTVGNIGSEKKMDYTVIGDTVNLGARLESLNKIYKVGLIFSHSVFQRIEGKFPCRLIDTVVVRGKTTGERIYTAQRSLSKREKQAWNTHHKGMQAYYSKDFKEALVLFQKTKELMPKDPISEIFIKRTSKYISSPPSKNWIGISTT